MFGQQFRKDKFIFPDDVTPINHGSFGAIPKRVYEADKKWLDKDLTWPDYFLFTYQAQKMEESLKLVSKVINTDYKNLALVQNATSGINTVFRSFPFHKGDTIVLSSVIYGSCGNTVDFVAERLGLKLKVVQITFPMSEQEVLKRFESAYLEVTTDKPKSAQVISIYDTICSMPGCRMPFEQITKLCKKYGIISVIDGAHSIGMIPIDIKAIGCDFYTSNLHKWLYLPRGCAVLYVSPKYQDVIMPFPISHDYKEQPFYKRFLFTASNNYSSFYCIPEALKFVEEDCGGFDKIRAYCKKLSEGIENHFGPERVVKVTDTSSDDLNFMVTIKVDMSPERQAYFAKNFKNPEFEAEARKFIAGDIFKEKKTYIQFGWHDSFLFVRFSCQIYNELDEYFWGYKQFEAELEKFYKSDLYAKYA